jgi:hypothetical protein
MWYGLAVEIVLVAIYAVATIIIPELLQVNKLSVYFLSVLVTPLLIIPPLSQCESRKWSICLAIYCALYMDAQWSHYFLLQRSNDCAKLFYSFLTCYVTCMIDSAVNPAAVYALWYVRTRGGHLEGTSVWPVQVSSHHTQRATLYSRCIMLSCFMLVFVVPLLAYMCLDYVLVTCLWWSQVEHILGPFVGAVIAGLICLRFCPDDASSWKRKC